MSGHSKWSTIKRKKGATDKARGKLFSKLARAISVAVKTGGGEDTETNYKLRVEIDRAKAANMPKSNIERAISQGTRGEALEEVSYEGFGPAGVGVIVEVATDNRNRTAQEVKNLFERGGGHMAGPGAVSFNFEPKGQILVKKGKDVEKQMLTLIDLGAEDVEETEDGIEVHVQPSKLSASKENLEKEGFSVISSELVKKPKSYHTLSDPKEAKRAISFLDTLEEQEDVQKVFATLDVPEDVMAKIA